MSSAQEDAERMFSCRCLNITINPTSEPATHTEPDYLHAFVGEDGIRIIHHYLTLRTRHRAQKSPNSPNKLIQPLATSCLACNTLVYRVAQEISPDAEAREGPVLPTEDWIEQETLRSKSGWVEVFVGPGGCLAGKPSIEQHSHSIHLSQIFSIAVLPPPVPTPTSPQLQAFSSQSQDSLKKSPIPSQLLPSLPPLFPPPPFIPSHPVFVSLSATAIQRSADLRTRAEDECKRFVQSQVDYLEKEEAQLRSDVQGIWRAYREGWKETLGKVKEERRLSISSKPERPTSATPVRSGVPLSIRDFSPIFQSHPQPPQINPASSQVLSPSLLSASLAQGGAHFPITVSQSSDPNTTTPDRAVYAPQSYALKPSTPFSQQTNGARSSGSSSISIRSNSDTKMLDAFRRNMDTNVDIASSLAWAKGEEEMRRRLGGAENDPTERARNRTSKNLGIGAVEKNANPNLIPPIDEAAQAAPVAGGEKTAENSGNLVVERSGQSAADKTAGPGVDGGVRSPDTGSTTESSDASETSKKTRRRVTFDVLPDVAIMTYGTSQIREPVPEVEMFDLDDLSSVGPAPEARAARPALLQPVTRTPSYKLHVNDGLSSVRSFQPASMPAPRVIQPLSPVNGASRWTSGSLKRSVGLADALPLLSSSVAAGDRLLANRSMVMHEPSGRPPGIPSPPPLRSRAHARNQTPSPAPPSIPDGAVEPVEAELKHLLAASAPSHRHAWREGGRAWDMFHQRSVAKRKAKGIITEEDSYQSVILEASESLIDEVEESDGLWHNPSQFASSLPMQIRPLAGYKPSLEPKTSLADKQGVLVPPLKMTLSYANSAAAFRRAVYAERDRIRSIDPGPALDFNEHDEIEDYLPEEIGEGERGRRHALSILQARSVVPEAGMWRSMAS